VQGIQRRLLVPMVRHSDYHSIDILTGENLIVIAGREEVLAPNFLAMRQAPIITVRRGHQLDSRHAHGDSCVVLALLASSDQSKLDLVICRMRTWRLALLCRKQMHPCPTDKETSCGQHWSSLEKISSVYSCLH